MEMCTLILLFFPVNYFTIKKSQFYMIAHFFLLSLTGFTIWNWPCAWFWHSLIRYLISAVCCIQEKIELAMMRSITNESEVSPIDVVGKVLGKENYGRVRCLGLGVVPRKAFKQTRLGYSGLNVSSYNNDSCSSQCQEKYSQILKSENQTQDNYTCVMNAHTQLWMHSGRIW